MFFEGLSRLVIHTQSIYAAGYPMQQFGLITFLKGTVTGVFPGIEPSTTQILVQHPAHHTRMPFLGSVVYLTHVQLFSTLVCSYHVLAL